jgi:ribonuclease P protein component
MDFKFGKSDKLKSKATIEQLFSEGKAITVFPLRLIYLETPGESKTKAGVSVSKRLHKTAVARNRIKRLMRETYRLNRPKYFNNSSTAYAFMILYISKDGTTFEDMQNSIKTLLQKFQTKIKSQ